MNYENAPRPMPHINTASQGNVEPNHAEQSQGQNIRRGGNKPDVYIQQVTRDGDKTYWEDVGATWDTSKDGYSKGKIKLDDGREVEIVTQTREARERALNKLRSQKREAQVELDNSPSQSL
jgi:predicted DNA-binding antitoxin AbrB/MazE fold protein